MIELIDSNINQCSYLNRLTGFSVVRTFVLDILKMAFDGN